MQRPGPEENYDIITLHSENSNDVEPIQNRINEKPKQKRGKWTDSREKELLKKYKEFQPFAQKKGQADNAWREILKAVNLKDENEKPVKYHSAVAKVNDLLGRFADSWTQHGSSSKTGVNHFSSDLEELAFKAKAAKDTYENGKNEEKRQKQERLDQRDEIQLETRNYAINGMNSRKRVLEQSTNCTEKVDDSKRSKTAENVENDFVDSDEDDEEETGRKSLKFLQNKQKHNDEFLQIQRERLSVEKGILSTLEAILHKMK